MQGARILELQTLVCFLSTGALLGGPHARTKEIFGWWGPSLSPRDSLRTCQGAEGHRAEKERKKEEKGETGEGWGWGQAAESL